MIDLGTAEYWVEKGLAEWAGNGQVGVTGRTKKTPRSASIEKAHMERAYIDLDEEEAARIEEYGLITVLSRVRIGRYYATMKQEPDGGRRHDYGRPILYMPDNDRTPGGIG